MKRVYVKCLVEKSPPVPAGSNEIVVSFDSVNRVKVAPVVNNNLWPSEGRDWVLTHRYFVQDSINSDYSGKVIEAEMVGMREDRGAYVQIRDLCGNNGRNLPNERTSFWVPLESLVA